MKLVRQFIIVCFLGNLVILALWNILQQTQSSEWIKSDKLIQLSRFVVPASILGSGESEKEANSTFETQPRKRLITPGDKEKQLKQGLGSLKKKKFVEFGKVEETAHRQEVVHDTPPEPQTGATLQAKDQDIEPDSPLSPFHSYVTEADASDHWQPVVEDALYVFSAYVNEVDYAEVTVVEVIGMKRTNIREMNVKCVLRYDAGETTVAGKMSDLGNENVKRVLTYQASTTVCTLPDARIPKSCTILTDNSVPNMLLVHYKEKYSYVEGSIHVCFAPFYNTYNDVSHVIEFVELQSLLGVSHFTFFNLSIGPGLDKVLQYYKQQGIATVLQYELPHPREIHIRGHHLTVHDCKMRSRGTAEYLILIDPDETIFPIQHESLLPMLRTLDSTTVSGFIFPCLYFCMEATDNRTALSFMDAIRLKHFDIVPYRFHLWTQLKTINSHKPCRITKNRINKMILKPWKVIRTSIHFILNSAPGSQPTIVSTKAATLHRYLTCKSGGYLPYPDVCPVRDRPVVDVVAHRYIRKLIPSVYQVMRNILALE